MKKSKVYCYGCAHFLLLEGWPPTCVATAMFVEGPIRKRIDVRGRVPAERRNRHNQCPYREAVSLRAYRLKRWIIWRLNNEGKANTGNKVKKINLRDYSVSTEGLRSESYRSKLDFKNGEEISGVTVEELIRDIQAADQTEDYGQQDLFFDGGTDDSDGGSSDDKG